MRYKNFSEFYPFYLTQHRQPGTRILHVLGTALVLTDVALAAAFRKPRALMLVPLLGYGPAWISHMFCERNRPATFQYPLWSLLADFKMFFSILTGKEPLRAETAEESDYRTAE